MKWKRALSSVLARNQSPRKLATMAGEISAEILDRVPRAERLAFLGEVAEAAIGPALRDLGREERAQLMNALLPLVVREFPLADLDVLAACSPPVLPEHASET